MYILEREKMSKELVDATYKVTDTAIHGFFEEHRYLSNFHLKPLIVCDVLYPSSEHAYMAQKTCDRNLQIEIAQIPTCGQVRRFGQTIPLRGDWEFYRVAAMLAVLYEKFKDIELAEMLLSTGDKYLEETNWWGDKFWGVCNGEGLNMLGKCLMLVRSSLRR